MDRTRMRKPSVRRCLFGRPSNSDSFMEAKKNRELEDETRFKRKWSLDGVENEIEWSRADADIPEFYTRGYSERPCKRRAVMPCIGKSLSFLDLDQEDECERVRAPSLPSPVSYCGSSTVEVFIGLNMPPRHQSPQRDHITPKKNDDSDDTGVNKVAAKDSSSSSLVYSVSLCSPQKTQKRKLQRSISSTRQMRLTDMWRSLKRRQGTLAVSGTLAKRPRIDRV